MDGNDIHSHEARQAAAPQRMAAMVSLAFQKHEQVGFSLAAQGINAAEIIKEDQMTKFDRAYASLFVTWHSVESEKTIRVAGYQSASPAT